MSPEEFTACTWQTLSQRVLDSVDSDFLVVLQELVGVEGFDMDNFHLFVEMLTDVAVELHSEEPENNWTEMRHIKRMLLLQRVLNVVERRRIDV